MDDIIKSVQQMYDEIGSHFSRTRQKTYDEDGSPNWPVTTKYLKELKSGQTVLDIGCGNGRLVAGLPAGVAYIGKDFSETLLAEARRLYPNHEFAYGNVVEPEMWSQLDRYDAIFCVAVLHHIPSRDQQLSVLSQAKKHLKRGGFMYLTVWNLWQEKFLQYHVDDHVEIPYDNKWKRYCVAFDIRTMTDLVLDSGWDIQEMFYADHEGKKSDLMHGQNLVVVAK
jgi:2-polyprenyl-3-methyl-5-hydroxy-6-metoxy-1,4-benzoquinol methylase